MVVSVPSLGLEGVDAYEVRVECFLSGGLPIFDIVGLPDTAVREARERVRAAMKNCDLDFPACRITINLAPAGQRKVGTMYDLPILVGIMTATGDLPPLPEGAAFLGELSLTGMVGRVKGLLPMAIKARERGIRQLFVPSENAAEATLAGGDMQVYGVYSMNALMKHLRGQEPIQPAKPWTPHGEEENDLPDMRDVMGQEVARRALEIAAAGGHNVLMTGFPGTGKSMLAKRLPSILPDMTRAEALESTAVWSVAGMTRSHRPLLTRRPFRSPHHTASAAALAGGGFNQRPGEISLAHNGVLFLDELPEFRRDALEILRQPLEDGDITVIRANAILHYPARFQLVCAMNPCRCGWLGHPERPCTCSPRDAERYAAKISGPLLDRIDIHIFVPEVKYEAMRREKPGECSADIKARVEAARAIQEARFAGTGVACNAQMTPAMIGLFCPLDEECEGMMRAAYRRLGLSARSHDRVLRVARTIADLDGEENIRGDHLAEALEYRDSEKRKE